LREVKKIEAQQNDSFLIKNVQFQNIYLAPDCCFLIHLFWNINTVPCKQNCFLLDEVWEENTATYTRAFNRRQQPVIYHQVLLPKISSTWTWNGIKNTQNTCGTPWETIPYCLWSAAYSKHYWKFWCIQKISVLHWLVVCDNDQHSRGFQPPPPQTKNMSKGLPQLKHPTTDYLRQW